MSQFLRVKCQCGEEQTIFSKPAIDVKCNACGSILAMSTGGLADVQANIIEKLE